MNADGSGKTHFGNGVTADFEPAWSPDGTEIAFIVTGNYFKTPTDTSSYMQLPGEPGGGLSVDWSPDGKAIAYAHTCEPVSGSSYIGIMEATPPYERTPVTSPTTCEGEPRAFPYWDTSPSWSPDGQRILFSRQPEGISNSTLYTIRPDGTDLQPVKGYAGRVQGRWSPDGSKIVVAFYPSNPAPGTCQSCIRVMNADGTGEIEIATGGRPRLAAHPDQRLPPPQGREPDAGLAGARLRPLHGPQLHPRRPALLLVLHAAPARLRLPHHRHPRRQRPPRAHERRARP